ncbi:unnamed protein product [Caenorhabditis bovis]|uniref:Uncharacterized protein n=1 Tax=Caenorhabditis bovis TaxID=2654633 RepID=A0A8S1EFQ1_9PELO|nr:unnamed protein product [Caenorhabditis bovis]
MCTFSEAYKKLIKMMKALNKEELLNYRILRRLERLAKDVVEIQKWKHCTKERLIEQNRAAVKRINEMAAEFHPNLRIDWEQLRPVMQSFLTLERKLATAEIVGTKETTRLEAICINLCYVNRRAIGMVVEGGPEHSEDFEFDFSMDHEEPMSPASPTPQDDDFGSQQILKLAA